jgi:hypothetical protein
MAPRVCLENIATIPDTSIRDSLEVILENYKDLNTTRCSRQGRMVISAFKGACIGIRDVLTQNLPGMDVWVDNLRTTGPWPAVPWIAFGGPARYMTDRGPFLININYHFVADMSGVLLVLLPNTEGWKERFGEKWLSKFEPFKDQFRKDLAWMKDHGFRLDDDADIASDDQDDLDVRDGYIAYKLYPAGNMPTEEELQRDIVIACKAQQQLVNKKR